MTNSEYISFFMNHALLSSALIIVLVLIIANEVKGHLGGAVRCSSQQLVNMMNHNDAIVIDIREKQDYRAGKIVHSKNIQPADLLKKVNEFDKVKPIIVVCSNGQQSEKQALILKKQGFNAHYLTGGIAAWRNDNMPLQK